MYRMDGYQEKESEWIYKWEEVTEGGVRHKCLGCDHMYKKVEKYWANLANC